MKLLLIILILITTCFAQDDIDAQLKDMEMSLKQMEKDLVEQTGIDINKLKNSNSPQEFQNMAIKAASRNSASSNQVGMPMQSEKEVEQALELLKHQNQESQKILDDLMNQN